MRSREGFSRKRERHLVVTSPVTACASDRDCLGVGTVPEFGDGLKR
jgi:hypothetical protein